MRVTLTTAICGVGDVGLTLDDARGADWIARGLASAPGAEVSEPEVRPVEDAPRATPADAPPAPEDRVPDFFAPEPPVTEPKRKRR